MILDANGDEPQKPARTLNEIVEARERRLNEISREDITFTVYPRNEEGIIRVVGMLNIGSAQQFNPVDYPDATPEVLVSDCMESICRGAGNRIYGKARSDALTAYTEGLKILNSTIGVKAEDILRWRALMEPLVEIGGELSGPDAERG